MATTADIPVFALPFRFENGVAAVLEQDSIEEVAQCVQVLVSTQLGERVELPDYGVPDPTFRGAIDYEVWLAQIEEWEPRARALISDSVDPRDALARLIAVRVGQR